MLMSMGNYVSCKNGFDMKMPPLVMDEIILLIDTYYKICAMDDKVLQQLYREDLSTTLRSLPFFPEYRNNSKFRNVAGMTLLLMNIDNALTNKWPITKLSRSKLDIINRYNDDQTLLSNIAQAIKLISFSQDFFGLLPVTNHIFLGGNLLLGYHIQLETKSDLSIQVKRNMVDLNISTCSICHDDLSYTYNSMASNLMELHFSAPIKWYTEKNLPTTNQFIFICPNCHHLAHSDVSLFEEETLKHAIKF